MRGAGELFEDGRRLTIVPDGRGGLAIVAQSGRPLAFRALAHPENLTNDEHALELVDDIAALLLSLELEHGDMPVAGADFWTRDASDPVLINRLSDALHCQVKVQALDRFQTVPVGLGERALAEFAPEPRRRLKSDRPIQIVADLAPLPWRQARAARRMRRHLLFASSILAMAWILAMGVFLGLLRWRTQKTHAFEGVVGALEKEALEVKELRTRVTGFELHLDRSRSALECLREVTQALPQGISLISLQYRKGGSVIVRGETLTVNLIYDFKDALDKSPLFKGVNLGPIQPNQRQHATVQVFQLSANAPGSEQ